MELQRTYHRQNNHEKEQSRKTRTSRLQNSPPSKSSQTESPWRKDREIDQCERAKSWEAKPHVCGQQLFNKTIQCGKNSLFKKWIWDNRYPHTKGWIWTPTSHHTQKSTHSGSQTSIQGLKLQKKFLEETIKINLHDLGFGNEFSDRTQKQEQQRIN